jgi:hypothetical protein
VTEEGEWFYVSSRFATGAVLVRNGKICKAPPIWRKFLGMQVNQQLRNKRRQHER